MKTCFQGEEVFTQRRCSECECRNGEIRCEEAENCGQVSQAECQGPEYLCAKGESSHRGKFRRDNSQK